MLHTCKISIPIFLLLKFTFVNNINRVIIVKIYASLLELKNYIFNINNTYYQSFTTII